MLAIASVSYKLYDVQFEMPLQTHDYRIVCMCIETAKAMYL